MVEHLYTLRRDLKDKSIYVWDMGRKAIWVFSALALRGVRVEGFVTNFSEFVGDTIMRLPIVSVDEFSELEDAIAIVDDDVREGAFNVVASRGYALYYSEALELNPSLECKSPYLYGTGRVTWDVAKKISRAGVGAVSGFIAERAEKPTSILGFPVYTAGEAPLNANDAVIVAADSHCQISVGVAAMRAIGFRGTLYVREVVPHFSLWGDSLAYVLDKAAKERRRLLLCCGDDASHALIKRMLSIYGINVDREVFLARPDESAGEDIWDLADEDPERSAVVIGSFSNRQRLEMLGAAYDLGYSMEKADCGSLQLSVNNEYLLNHVVDYEYDVRMLASIDYSCLGGKPGWMVHGDEAEATVRIVVVGGSTSTELYYPESWVEKLYKMFEADGVKAVVFNGANEGNGVTQEMSRLLRDIHALKPDFVISLSGVNDQRAQENKFEQVHGDNPFEFWRRVEKYMKLVVEEEGAEFIAILQPMNACMRINSLFENMYFTSENHKWGRTFLFGVRDDDFYFNFLDMFHHQDGAYIDRCHYSDAANRIIAEHVYQLLKERL